MHNSRAVAHTDNLDLCPRTGIDHRFRLSTAISTSRNSDISMKVVIDGNRETEYATVFIVRKGEPTTSSTGIRLCGH